MTVASVYRCQACYFTDTRAEKAVQHTTIRGGGHVCRVEPTDASRPPALAHAVLAHPLVCVACHTELAGASRPNYCPSAEPPPSAPFFCAECGAFNVMGDDGRLRSPTAADETEHGAMMRTLRKALNRSLRNQN
jgi:hypothetical protein